jgi:hypothetical protein
MTDPTYLTDNIHLIRMAVDHFLWHYYPETDAEYLTENEMMAFQLLLEKHNAD